MRRAAAILLLVLLAACGGRALFPSETNGRAAWDSRPEGRAWTQMTRLALDSEGANLMAATPGDVNAFCPNYAALEPSGRREFWAMLVSEIAAAESGLDPAAVKGPRRGLLGISPDAARGYGCANVGVAQLNDPQTNLACGVRILAATAGRDGLVSGYTAQGWRGAGRFWTSLRRPEAIADLQQHLNDQSFCRRRTA
ncbi:MAG: transglycosylase SLT domain-containing protein [Hyphomonadaceae bacterium]